MPDHYVPTMAFTAGEEAAGRKLCELRGEDPDGLVMHGGPNGLAICVYTELWRFAAGEMREFRRMRFVADTVRVDVGEEKNERAL